MRVPIVMRVPTAARGAAWGGSECGLNKGECQRDCSARRPPAHCGRARDTHASAPAYMCSAVGHGMEPRSPQSSPEPPVLNQQLDDVFVHQSRLLLYVQQELGLPGVGGNAPR